jgi:hypothetical protein
MANAERVNKYKKKSKSSGGESSSTCSSGRGRKRTTLATEKFHPSNELHRYPIILYGEKKIGKTTLLSQFPKAYSFMFEPNDSYELYKNDILDWQDFVDLVPQFLQGEHEFESCWIDNGRNCYELALDFVCRKAGIEHPSQMNDFGQTWAKVFKEFSLPIRQLMQSKFGFGVTCHQVEKDIETRTGRTFVQIAPDLSSAAARLFCGEIYNIFYYHFEGTERYLQIQGDDYVTAGHRMKGHFLTTKGERVHRIPMGDSEEEAYENLIRAFENKQELTHAPKAQETKEEKANKFKKKKAAYSKAKQ